MPDKPVPENSPLHRIFVKNQSKVVKTQRVGRVLTSMASDQHILIARLLQKWLEEDSNKRNRRR